MRHRAVPGTLGCRFEQFREVDGPHEEDACGVPKLPCAPSRAMGKDRVPMPLFNGHSVLRRVRIAGAAADEEQGQLPLQKVNVWTLPLDWARGRLNNKALRRFDAKWRYALRPPEPHSSNYEL
ncbi:hypothetical protein ERJ75_000666100 [Trypanosoma vivax]|nr:hypothetical protein ERJ75_000666100 [Trypanosoma vivax]